MKKITLVGVVFLFGLFVFGVYKGITVLTGDSFDKAIKQFEKGRYARSIESLNRLAATADYDELERIYYYRVRAVNRLAESLEDEYASELKAAAAEKRNRPGFEEAVEKIKSSLSEVNEKINGDLDLLIARQQSRIIPGGRFYNEFTARFRGSPYIEDLMFEELDNISRTEPERFIDTAASFYSRYPDSPYLPRIINMIMDSMRKGTATISGRSDQILNMITNYAARYPTSPDINRILVCTGDNVNLRNSPSTSAQLAGRIDRHTVLIQLERSMDTMQIGDARDYWYRVASVTGETGWIFGSFVNQIDPSEYADKTGKEVWSIVEDFSDWTDSNTPANWIHIEGATSSTVSFTARQEDRIAIVNSGADRLSGLFMRQPEARAFTVSVKAKFVEGDSVYIAARNVDGTNTFYIRLGSDSVESSGRIIPLDTSRWHEYTLSSDDGKYARLYLNNELIAGKIEPEKLSHFTKRGIYTLFTPEGENGVCEIEYIKIR